MDTSLMTLNSLNQAKELIAVANVHQLKDIIARADALRVYAQQAKAGLEIQNQVAEVKIRAERRIGELLKVMPKQHGARDGKMELHDATPSTLKELGIEKTQSHRWQQVASLPEKEFEQYVVDVKKSNEELTTVGAIRLVRQMQPKKEAPPLPEGKYQVIYADPPWEYDNSGLANSASKQYPTMPTEDICALQIPSSDNSVLFLWVTNPFLKEGIQVCESWGFEYKTNFVWVKNKGVGGFYVSGKHELLFIATKGAMTPTGKIIESVLTGDNSIHSKKPDSVYEIIENMYPDMAYLELFARRPRIGWKSWGNQV